MKYKEAKDEKEEALWRTVGAVVAKKFFAENIDDPVWWALLLLGDGVVRVRDHVIGFAAEPAEAAEAVMHIFARVMGVSPEVRREGMYGAVLSREASREAVEELFRRLEEARVGDTPAHQLLAAVAEWWLGVGTGGSDPPKLLSLRAFRELAAGREGRWLGTWWSYEAVVTTVPEEVARWLEGVYRVSVEPPQRGTVGLDVYFERGGERFKLYTDFSNFYLHCDSCRKPAKDVLTVVAKALGVDSKVEGNILMLPADVGWAIFLKLWARHDMSLPIRHGGRELLRVEVLEARTSGFTKFRLWYYKWRETRPDRPYVDIEITYRGKRQGFIGRVSVNVAEGILREHLAEIADLLKREGVRGVSLRSDGEVLYFTGAFRDSVLAELGIKPELPPGEPPAVEYLGGLRFKVGDREVEFARRNVRVVEEFYAELKFPSEKEAVNFAKSLMAIGVDAEVRGNAVRLDSDAFFGLLAATGATPPGLKLLYSSEEGDFRVYAAVEGSRMRFYFAVKHGGVWRAVEGLYKERSVDIWRKERDVLEAIRGAVEKALEKLVPDWQSRPAKVEEPREKRDEKGNVKGHYFRLYGPHITPFLEHAGDGVKAKPVEVQLEGKRIVISAGDVKAEVEFKLLKRGEAEFLMAKDVGQILALYKSLRKAGVRVEIAPKGVKVDSETLWALVAAAVERSPPNVLPAEVMPGVELLKVYNVSEVRMYVFRVSEEGVHYYFTVKTKEGWKAAGGKYFELHVQIHGEAARAVADAINTIYREMGVDRRIEVKLQKGAPYINLTNVDLRLLGII